MKFSFRGLFVATSSGMIGCIPSNDLSSLNKYFSTNSGSVFKISSVFLLQKVEISFRDLQSH